MALTAVQTFFRDRTRRAMGLLGLPVLLLGALLPLGSPSAADTPPFLYVIVGDDADLTAQGDGYALTMENDEIFHVLEISKSPFGLANHISMDRILSTWRQGASDFGAGVTMKGTILSEEGTLEGVNISSITKTAREIVLLFTLDGNATVHRRMLGDIDDVTIVNYCCHPDGGSAQWLWGR